MSEDQKSKVVYLKLLNGESVVGITTEVTDETLFVEDVLEYIKSHGQFTPYDPFLGESTFQFERKFIMRELYLSDTLSAIYHQAVETFKTVQEEEQAKSNKIIVPDNKIVR